jgi:5-(carboxyamino)imidazole ribonucleotide synthase
VSQTVGIVGGGQLGYFLALAAQELGFDSKILGFAADEPCNVLAGHAVVSGAKDKASLAAFAKQCSALTYEFENLDADWLSAVEGWTPNLASLRHAQDRVKEKTLCQTLQIPVTPFRAVDSAADLDSAIAELGCPLVLKTRRMGYDGKGQAVIRSAGDSANVLQKLGGKDLIAEAFIPFDAEVSLIGARSKSGEAVFFPLNENRHEGGILRVTIPQRAHPLQKTAEDFMQRLFSALEYVGVLTIEFFVQGHNLMVNELAPRVHNSGHWTLEGSTLSQFAAHIRAICDLPLPAPQTHGYPAMVNIISERPKDVSNIPGFLHDYRKVARAGRKLGHITAIGETPAQRDNWVAQVAAFCRSV